MSCVQETTASLLKLLAEHIFINTVDIDKTQYIQRTGIAQGSILSTLLCNLYYADMEHKVVFPRLHQSALDFNPRGCHHEVLMRYTDDFMYVSTRKARAIEFVSILQQGIPSYNCTINLSKSQFSFNLEDSPGHILVAKSNTIIWCGLRIDPNTGEININYAKYVSYTIFSIHDM